MELFLANAFMILDDMLISRVTHRTTLVKEMRLLRRPTPHPLETSLLDHTTRSFLDRHALALLALHALILLPLNTQHDTVLLVQIRADHRGTPRRNPRNTLRELLALEKICEQFLRVRGRDDTRLRLSMDLAVQHAHAELAHCIVEGARARRLVEHVPVRHETVVEVRDARAVDEDGLRWLVEAVGHAEGEHLSHVLQAREERVVQVFKVFERALGDGLVETLAGGLTQARGVFGEAGQWAEGADAGVEAVVESLEGGGVWVRL